MKILFDFSVDQFDEKPRSEHIIYAEDMVGGLGNVIRYAMEPQISASGSLNMVVNKESLKQKVRELACDSLPMVYVDVQMPYNDTDHKIKPKAGLEAAFELLEEGVEFSFTFSTANYKEIKPEIFAILEFQPKSLEGLSLDAAEEALIQNYEGMTKKNLLISAINKGLFMGILSKGDSSWGDDLFSVYNHHKKGTTPILWGFDQYDVERIKRNPNITPNLKAGKRTIEL